MIDKKYTITVLKERISYPSPKQFYVDYDSIPMYPRRLPKKKVADMTKDEQADEIINRLKAPPVSKFDYELEEHYAEILSKEIAKEIDRAVFNSITIYDKKYFST